MSKSTNSSAPISAPKGPEAMVNGPSTQPAKPSAKPPTKFSKGGLKKPRAKGSTGVSGSHALSSNESPDLIDLGDTDESTDTTDTTDSSAENTPPPADGLHQHLDLIQGYSVPSRQSHQSLQSQAVKEKQIYSLQTTPLFSSQVKTYVDASLSADEVQPFTMFGLLGLRLATYVNDAPIANSLPDVDNLVYSNTAAPWSTFICGQQGAGKSYTFSCLLENALLQGHRLGRNGHPLTGLVFHYDKHAGAYSTQICEAAYLCSRGIKIDVLTSPTNIRAMQEAYKLADIPDHHQPRVKPLLFDEPSLKLDYMLTLMNQTSGKMPLYMSAITNIIRTMKINNTPFSIRAFEKEIDATDFREDQLQMLNLRMDLLKSFMWSTAMPEHREIAKRPGIHAAAGHLTIVDLSCSTVNEGDVCTLYEICLSMFLASRNSPPRSDVKGKGNASEARKESPSLVVAIDEAHKFLTEAPEAMSFTEELIRLIRQQRHLKARVVIATQEPTLSPQLMDLCNVSIVHRFRSPAWFDTIKNHLTGLTWTGNISSTTGKSVFETIVGLQDGEALLFASDAYLDAPAQKKCFETKDSDGEGGSGDHSDSSTSLQDGGSANLEADEGLGKGISQLTLQQTTKWLSKLERLKTAYIKVQIRQRLTRDGGQSQMAA